jgi:hypothetical protein
MADSSTSLTIVRRGVDPWPVALVVALVAALVLLLPRPLSSDISGQLWIAQQIRQGARLYFDILEINPPLWFWMAVPVQALAGASGLPAEGLLIAATGAAALASLVATDRLLGWMPVTHRRAFLLYAALVLLVMPLRDLGQREQLALFSALPYAALAAARRRGAPVGLPLTLLVGAGSALGFALKHYFLAAPVLLELWLLLSLRRGWRPLRAETLALAAVGLGYGAAILVATPEYLTEMVPRLRLAYGALAPSLRQMILPAQLVWAFTLVAIAPQLRLFRAGRAPLSTALLIAALGFGIAWLIQHKGWPYQSIPTTGLVALAFAAMLVEGWEAVGSLVRKLAPAVLLLPVALALTPTHAPVTPETDIAPALAGLPPGSSVAIVSTEGITAWPSAVNRGFRFPSRHGLLWMLPAIDAHPGDPRVQALGREVIRQTVIDYRCLPPERIVFVRPDSSGTATTASADPMRFFLRDPAFAELMSRYTRWKHAGIYDAYRLTGSLAPVRGAACRRGA